MKRIITLLSIIAILFVNIEPAVSQEESKVTVESTVAYPEAPEIDGHAAILIDMDTGATPSAYPVSNVLAKLLHAIKQR